MPQKSDVACVIATLLVLVALALLNWVFQVQWAWGLLIAYPLVSHAVIVQMKRDTR